MLFVHFMKVNGILFGLVSFTRFAFKNKCVVTTSIFKIWKMNNWAHASIVPLEKFNFHFAFRPTYYFSRCIGLWPFSVAHDSNKKIWKASVGFLDVLRSILMICLSSTLVFCAYEEIRTRQKDHTNTIRFVVFMTFQLSSFSFITIGVVLDLINRNRLADILGKFNTFDHKVSSCFSDSFF